MATDKSTREQKKELAQLLYLKGEMTQKQIAERVGVSERTMSLWANDGNWENMKKSLLASKENILMHLYALLLKVGEKLKEEDSIGDAKIADMYVKYTASIKNLETETGIAQIVEVSGLFLKWLKDFDPALTLSVAEYLDKFIKQRIKKF